MEKRRQSCQNKRHDNTAIKNQFNRNKFGRLQFLSPPGGVWLKIRENRQLITIKCV